MVELSTIQHLAQIRKATGSTFRLSLGESLISVHVSDEIVIAAVRAAKVKEYVVGYRVIAQGTKMVSWQLQADGTWSESRIVVWDEDFTPYEVGTLGGKPPQEYREQQAWEDDCFRPGNGTRLGQRDSADRRFQGYDYSRPQFYSTTTPKG